MEIAVLGSGSWGSALALICHRAKNKVTIWSRNNNTTIELNNKHTNKIYLPDILFPESIKGSNNLKSILNNEALLLTIPSQNIRQLCQDLAHLNLSSDKILIICAKGIEQKTLKLLSEVVEDILPNNPIAVLSGPNFAREVAQGLPAIASLACSDRELSINLAKNLSSSNFRIYPNQDIIGTQIIGAAKNVLAIATGIAIGKNLGENAKSAIFSRGICDINSLISAKGGLVDTIFSPAGIGDLNLTCSSSTSRNTSYGIALANGDKNSNGNLVEGFFTAESIYNLAKNYGVEVPVIEAIYNILYQNHDIEKTIHALLNRPIKAS